MWHLANNSKTMMLDIQAAQEFDYENPSSNAESEDENDLPEDWILT